MTKSIQNNKSQDCPVCNGTRKAKVIKNIAQIGKYHLGKEITEECKFCSEKYLKKVYELEGDTLH